MAKVLLIQPLANHADKNPTDFNLPLSLIYLGTAIEHKHEVQIYDRNVEDRDYEKFLMEYKPDIVGLPSWTSSLLQDVIIVGKLTKKLLPQCTIIVGGVHATTEPQSVLDESYVDYILRGEGDEAFLEFCDVYEQNPEKLSEIKNINLNPIRPFLDINTLKTPNYDLVDVSKYNRVYINLSRGCPGDCTFCYNAPMWGIPKAGFEEDIIKNRPFVRVLKTEKMIEIFKMVIEKYNRKSFTVVDDNLVFFKKRVIEVCDYLKNNYTGLNWFCESRVDTICDEVVSAMKSAGCHYIQLGVESGSQRMLDFLNKTTTVEQNAEAIACIKKHGILADASIMIGIPTETREELRETVDFVKRTDPDHPNAKFYMLWPSALLDYCVAKGWVEKPKNLTEWSTWIGSIRSLGKNYSDIPDEEIEKAAYEIWSHGMYRRKIKAFYCWLKRGDISLSYILRGLRKALFVRGRLHFPIIGTVKFKKDGLVNKLIERTQYSAI